MTRSFFDGDVSPEESKYLLNEFPLKTLRHVSPKNPQQTPGRPLVSATGSRTERISSFVDYHFKVFH